MDQEKNAKKSSENFIAAGALLGVGAGAGIGLAAGHLGNALSMGAIIGVGLSFRSMLSVTKTVRRPCLLAPYLASALGPQSVRHLLRWVMVFGLERLSASASHFCSAPSIQRANLKRTGSATDACTAVETDRRTVPSR